MFAYSQHTLRQLESLIKALGIRIRYEKGNFKNNTCVLQNEELLVINQFSDLEVKIKAMVEVIQRLEIPKEFEPDTKQEKLLLKLKQYSLNL